MPNPIIITVRGTKEQLHSFSMAAKVKGVTLNAFALSCLEEGVAKVTSRKDLKPHWIREDGSGTCSKCKVQVSAGFQSLHEQQCWGKRSVSEMLNHNDSLSSLFK
jgi:hypothetical protein